MHPVIRIINYLVLSLALAAGARGTLLVGAVVVGALSLRVGADAWAAMSAMLRRLRWLWLSLAIVYFWFTPGVPLLPVSAVLLAWMPTVEGVVHGALRIAALALMAMAAALLLHLTPREQLIAALYSLAAPLAWLGVARERLAVRMALTLAAVSEVRTEVQAVTARRGERSRSWRHWGAIAAALLQGVMRRAETAPCVAVALPPRTAPPAWQWLLPVSLAGVMFAAMLLSPP